jgi:hypothetical protein
MVSPFRNFLGVLKPPPLLPGIHGFEESPRGSMQRDGGWEFGVVEGNPKWWCGEGRGRGGEQIAETQRDGGQGLVMVAFDANVKEVLHGGIVWAIEHVLKRGDTLAVVSVLDCAVRRPFGTTWGLETRSGWARSEACGRGDLAEAGGVEELPGVGESCEKGGVKQVVMVKAVQRGELAICNNMTKMCRTGGAWTWLGLREHGNVF